MHCSLKCNATESNCTNNNGRNKDRGITVTHWDQFYTCMGSQFVSGVTLKHKRVWRPPVSRKEGRRTLTENKTPNWTAASSTAVFLTFNSETRHVSVTWRKHCWLTRLILCPWRHYKSALPGHWYLWLDIESDIRNSQIQTDSTRGEVAFHIRGSLFFFFFNMKLKSGAE